MGDILPMDTTILAKDQLMPNPKPSHITTWAIIHIMLDTTILAKDQLMPNLKATHGEDMVAGEDTALAKDQLMPNLKATHGTDMVAGEVTEDTTGVRKAKQ